MTQLMLSPFDLADIETERLEDLQRQQLAAAKAAEEELRRRDQYARWLQGLEEFGAEVTRLVKAERAKKKDQRNEMVKFQVMKLGRFLAQLQVTPGLDRVVTLLQRKLKVEISFYEVPTTGTGWAESEGYVQAIVRLKRTPKPRNVLSAKQEQDIAAVLYRLGNL